MSWLYSQALVEEYLAATCSDGAPSAPLNTNRMQQAYLSPGRMTAFSRLSRFGMTFAPLTESLGADLLTWYLADSRARTYQPQEKAQELKANDPGCGVRWRELLVKYDRDSSTWKTHRCLWDEDLAASSLTLPKWGSMRNGELSERVTLERRTVESVFGFSLPTAVASDATCGAVIGKNDTFYTTSTGMPRKVNQHGKDGSFGLGRLVQMWPTPIATEWKDGCGKTGNRSAEKVKKAGLKLSEAVKMYPTPTVNDSKNSTLPPSQIKHDNIPGALLRDGEIPGGQLNPTWVEWLMGWPLGWTDLKPLATDKFQQWQQQHSGF